MAAQYCSTCGNPLPPDARFCAVCGAPVPSAGTVSNATPAAPFPPSSIGPSGPALDAKLGVEGRKKFLIQHQLLTPGHNYRVLSEEEKLLFTVEEDLRQELDWNVFHRPASPPPSGPAPPGTAPMGPALTLVWRVADSSDVPQAQISIRVIRNTAVSTLRDLWGAPVLSVSASRTLLGDLQATAAFPDGRAMFQTRGNLLRHDFTIQDPSGREVARIHEAWVSVRDTYRLDIEGDVDPLGPLIFAVLIDRERQG